MRLSAAVRQADLSFPRSDKIALMAAEMMIARQLTYFAAREKDSGRRCDLEAGMAKLLGARVAWAAADNALQIHGGNGFALEYPVSPAFSATPASSTSSRARPKFRRRSSPAACWNGELATTCNPAPSSLPGARPASAIPAPSA
jgi:hypothetical protein